MASCFQHINECLYVVKSQLRSHWAKIAAEAREQAARLAGQLEALQRPQPQDAAPPAKVRK